MKFDIISPPLYTCLSLIPIFLRDGLNLSSTGGCATPHHMRISGACGGALRLAFGGIGFPTRIQIVLRFGAHIVSSDIARIFEDVGGYYVCSESEDYLDTRGKAYPNSPPIRSTHSILRHPRIFARCRRILCVLRIGGLFGYAWESLSHQKRGATRRRTRRIYAYGGEWHTRRWRKDSTHPEEISG